jgi:MFS family permease
MGDGLSRSNRKHTWQVLVGTSVGTTLEWFDFLAYGLAASFVFPALFFPETSEVVGLLASFATFAVGFVARPVGGIIFGHFGDRLGRKHMLLWSLALTGGATFLIGVLPSYKTVGIIAPITLVILRVLQGLGLGGELGGAFSLSVEHAPTNRRGLYGSFPQLGSPFGAGLASLLLSGGVLLLSKNAFLNWGWRVPFLLTIVLAAVGWYIRSRLAETPEFQHMRATDDRPRLPFGELVREHPAAVFVALCMWLATTAPYYVINVFLISYVTTAFNVSSGLILAAILGANVLFIGVTVGMGRLSDSVGKRPIFLAGTIAIVVLSFPVFSLAKTGNIVLIWLAIALMGTAIFLCFAVAPALFVEQFPARVRYSGLSVAVQFASAIGGGTAPLIATALLSRSNGQTWPVSLYIMLPAVISAIGVYFAKEMKGVTGSVSGKLVSTGEVES